MGAVVKDKQSDAAKIILLKVILQAHLQGFLLQQFLEEQKRLLWRGMSLRRQLKIPEQQKEF